MLTRGDAAKCLMEIAMGRNITNRAVIVRVVATCLLACLVHESAAVPTPGVNWICSGQQTALYLRDMALPA